MAENQVALETKGIKRALKGFSVYDAISEYIWNGFDAGATKIAINFQENDLHGIERVSISDNGCGISKETLLLKFTPVFDSNKATLNPAGSKNSSITHGKNGVGRFTFFTFSEKAVWSTVYADGDKHYRYSIEIQCDTLDKYRDSEKVETNEPIGTTVTFYNFSAKDFDFVELYKYLSLEFAWYLELNAKQNITLTIDDQALDYSQLLDDVETINYTYEKTKEVFNVKFCRWNTKLHEEYSKYYYINSRGFEVYKENTTLNNKGDKFYHSVFIQSKIFDNFMYEADEDAIVIEGNTKSSPAFIFIKEQVDKHLRNMRNPYIKQYTRKYISDLKAKGAYPKLQSDNFMDRVREQSLDEMISVIYSAEPKIFSNLNVTQQKTLIRLFDMSMQSGEIENLYAVLEGVMDMSSEDRADLAGLLKYTNLSNITKTIAIIKDRLEVIQKLKYLVLDEERYSTEIDHIQPFIEKNYWIFGEQYYLVTAEEPDFEEALRRYLYVLRGEDHPKGTIHIDSMHRQKEMDIFAVQRRLDGTVKKCIVVELKRPSKVLGSKELQQVKNYFSVIDGESRFNAPNIDWEFFLVGNDYNKEIADEIESARHHGERPLVFSVGRKKIYVKKWSEIFTEHEINLNFLHEKLAIKQEELIKTFSGMSPDKVAVSENTATMPPEVQVG